ncbi:HD-GYP domain-containing protein [Paenibacillus sp. y28]|uniref:HD-GYP domain-containing protein n=1 Tax=Paenibacillus sp. y28 TaxID=3129110 RepID=UPI003015B0EE
MRKHITDLQVGDKLSGHIYNRHGLLILSAGATLDSEGISKLFLHNIDFIDIEDRAEDRVPAQFSSNPEAIRELSEKVQPLFDSAINHMKGLFKQVSDGKTLNLKQTSQGFEPLIEKMQTRQDLVSILLTLTSTDEYTYQHSVQVGILSYYLAKWLRHSEKDAELAGQAGYLHDIGKAKIPASILSKPARLSEAEFAEIKNHPIYGYELIKASLNNELVATAALQHHERLNGKGYPAGLEEREIHPLARIVAVADVYSAMISSRVYQKERDLLHVLKELHRLSFEELDPEVVHVFIKNMLPNFVGKRFSLRTGEAGTIVWINMHDFFRPLVKLEDHFIDLSKERDLEIDTIYM